MEIQKEDQLLRQILPEHKSLIWLTNEPLNELPLPFHTINYLLDGLLSKSLHLDRRDRMSYFLSKNFGQMFGVFHLQYDKKYIREDIKQLGPLMHNSLEQGKVVILDDGKIPLGEVSKFLTSQNRDYDILPIL